MANTDALDKLKAVMEESGKSVEEIFIEIDTDGDGKVNYEEFVASHCFVSGSRNTSESD